MAGPYCGGCRRGCHRCRSYCNHYDGCLSVASNDVDRARRGNNRRSRGYRRYRRRRGYNLTVSVADPEVAQITGISLPGDAAVNGTTRVQDGTGVRVRVVGMDTADTGQVTIASIIVEATAERGTTDVNVSIDALGDESGNAYTVSGTEASQLTVGDASQPTTSTPTTTTTSGDSSTITGSPGQSPTRSGRLCDAGSGVRRVSRPASRPSPLRYSVSSGNSVIRRSVHPDGTSVTSSVGSRDRVGRANPRRRYRAFTRARAARPR